MQSASELIKTIVKKLGIKFEPRCRGNIALLALARPIFSRCLQGCGIQHQNKRHMIVFENCKRSLLRQQAKSKL